MNLIANFDRLLQVLQQRIFTSLDTDVPLRFRRAENDDRATVLTEPRDGWQSVDRDIVWGEPDGYYWFAGTATIPESAAGRRVFCRVEAQFGSVMGRSDPQCLVRINGRIAQGVDGNHREFLLTENAVPGQRFELVIEAGTIEDRRQLGFGCRLLIHDPLAEKLYFDLKVPLCGPAAEARRCAPQQDPQPCRSGLEGRRLPARRPRTVHRKSSRRQAHCRPHLCRRRCRGDADDFATGHTHIDVAWLWRVRETRQKMARSMATALA